MRAKELRELGEESLEEKLLELKTQLSKERGTISSGTRPENPGKIKKTRRIIARILTIINERQRLRPKELIKTPKKEIIGEEIKQLEEKKKIVKKPKTVKDSKSKKLKKSKKLGGKKKK